MTARTWAERVAAVEHAPTCIFSPNARHCVCDCFTDRDARIGRGIEAVRESDQLHSGTKTYSDGCEWCRCGFLGDYVGALPPHRDAAAARAFEEAV